jgi:hypothetical protein
MRLRNYVIGGLCSAVIVAQGASTPGGNDPAVGDDGLDVVPEANLKDMRGGMELTNNLVGYFAIDRVVEVDGQVVAKMQIVVSNLEKLGSGQMPTVTVSGPLSELVQFMNGLAVSCGSAGSVGSTGVPAAVVAAAKQATSSSGSTAAGVNGSSGSAGNASAAAAAASQAAGGGTFTVNVGSGTTVIPASGTAPAVAGSAQGAAGSAGASVTSNISGGGGGSGSSGQSTAGTAETINKVIPIGNSGQYVVVSNLPSSAGLATAIQNEVRGTLVQVQTTITAQLNSLTLLNSAALANAIRSTTNLPTTTGK